MKKRVVQEAMVGYLFAAPIIISICIFTLYPIISAFIYSFTDFNPLEIKKFDIKFNPQDAIEINTGFLPSELSEKEVVIDFDLMTFIELDVGLKLDAEKSDLVQKYFDSSKLLKDFSEGKLDKEIAIKDFMGTYMTMHGDQFRKYRPKFLWF
ncbi:MAG TPA: sugar ABC transporter permease, partial [Petrotogaceae bacterium]|nr:sugar ABC transporter permease [Petrotogaceae bacterium]